MEKQRLNEPSDLSLKTSEQAKPSAKLPRNSKKRSTADRAREEPKHPETKLSVIDYLLSIWQSDSAELRRVGVEAQISADRQEGRPVVNLKLFDVAFCENCQRLHGTIEPHICIQ